MGAAKELKKLINDELRKLRGKLTQPEIIKKMGDESIDIIFKRTRAGYGVDKPRGSIEKLAPLAKSTIEARKKKSLSSKTSPGKSNLTETGSMLDNLRLDIKKDGFTIRGGTPKDSEKAFFAHAGSDNRPPRPFLFLATSETKLLAERLKEFIAKVLKR